MRDNNLKQISYIPEEGQTPPQSTEAEEAVLGAAIIEEDAAMQIIGILKPEMFYNPRHQHIYSAIYDMTNLGKVVDIITLTGELRKRGELEEIGGPVYLTELMSKIASSANIEAHAHIVKEKYTAREYLRLSTQIQMMVYNQDDIKTITETAENEIFKISNQTQTKEPKRIDAIIDDTLIITKKIIDNPHELVGIPSGFSNIDRITGGWQNTDLIIIAARPSQGKSLMASICAKNAALHNYPVAFFSLEMSSHQLAVRYLAGISEYSNMDIRNGRIRDFNQLVTSSEQIASTPLFIDDTPAINIAELRSKTKKLIIKNGIKLIVVDYLQLMSGIGQSREQEVASISRGLKGIAKEFSIPVIALAQVNRDVENRADKRPTLSTLRESGGIEADADIVAFIYRPSTYGMTTININNEDVSTNNLMIFDIQKNRNGALFPVMLYHDNELSRICDNIDDINKIPF